MSLPLHKARAIAERIVYEIEHHCLRIEIAGSIRRERDVVGDIDIVCEPEDQDAKEAIARRVAKRCKIEKNGPELLCAHMENGVQIDLWFARPETTTGDLLETKTLPGNFGSVLLCRTGSKEHNIALVEHAKRMGLRWHPHDGVMRGNEVIASETEEEIFAALSLRFIPVHAREAGHFSYQRWMRVNAEGETRRPSAPHSGRT